MEPSSLPFANESDCFVYVLDFNERQDRPKVFPFDKVSRRAITQTIWDFHLLLHQRVVTGYAIDDSWRNPTVIGYLTSYNDLAFTLLK